MKGSSTQIMDMFGSNTFSAMLSSLRNWANHDRYRLRPSTPAQLCWSSSRLQLFQKYNLIKFARTWPLTLNYTTILWNCRGVPKKPTCLTVFLVSQCPNFHLDKIVYYLYQQTLSIYLCLTLAQNKNQRNQG